MTSGLKRLTRFASPMPSHSPTLSMAACACLLPAAAASMTSATSTWSSPIPAARVMASRPISVSQQPWAPQRQITPVGLTTMWPTSPP